MKIVRKRTHTISIKAKSVNEKFTISIDPSFGPELVLANDTVVIFSSSVVYFNLIGDKVIDLDNIDLDALKIVSTEYIEDDIARCKFEARDITHAVVYTVYGYKVYVLSTKR